MERVFLLVLLSYFLGGVPFGYLAVRALKGVDITQYGSGATGATNVNRLIGTGPAIIVGLLDITKGVLAVTLGRNLTTPGDYLAPVLCGLAAMAGHNYSPFLRFKGGKGVAAGAGIMLALMPRVVIIAAIGFVIIVAITRYVSLGSMLGALVAVGAAFATRQPVPYEIFSLLGAAFIIFRHQSNIKRLLQGKESRLGERVKIE